MAAKTVQFSFLIICMSVASSALIDEDGLQCEDLKQELCAYSVSSDGSRCMPKMKVEDDHTEYVCMTSSSIQAPEQFYNWVESDECINKCGLSRMSMTIAIMQKLCSQECLNECPNIADFYSGLGDGLLEHACKTGDTVTAQSQEAGPAPAPAPTSAQETGPASAPAFSRDNTARDPW